MKRQSALVKLAGALLLCTAATVDGASQGKVDICHIPPGNPANAHTINVSVNAVKAHLAHGDSLGACDDGGGGGEFCPGDCWDASLGNCDDGTTPAPGPWDNCPSTSDGCCEGGA